MTRRILKSPLRAALGSIPLGVRQRLFPRDVVGLYYHVISDEDLPHLKHYAYKDESRFEADVSID